MAAIIKLNQIELVWSFQSAEWREPVLASVSESERKMTKVSESKMALSESNIVEFKMAAIIKLSQNEWVWIRLN